MRSQVVIPLVVLLVAAQTCCCCTILGGPQPPYTVSHSEQAFEDLEARMDAIETGPDGSFSVTITEEELTSLVVHNLDEREGLSSIQEPQVLFRNGRIECYAKISPASSLALPGLIAISLDAQDSKLDVTIEEIVLGPLPIPQSILETFTDLVVSTIVDLFSSEQASITINDVEIGNGELTISGQITAN